MLQRQREAPTGCGTSCICKKGPSEMSFGRTLLFKPPYVSKNCVVYIYVGKMTRVAPCKWERVRLFLRFITGRQSEFSGTLKKVENYVDNTSG